MLARPEPLNPTPQTPKPKTLEPQADSWEAGKRRREGLLDEIHAALLLVAEFISPEKLQFQFYSG